MASPPPALGPTVLRPLCSSCRRPLQKHIIASKCNHAFHRDCLLSGGASCPKCNDPNWKTFAVELYGIDFSEGSGPTSSDVTVLAAVQERLLRDAEGSGEATLSADPPMAEPKETLIDPDDDDIEIVRIHGGGHRPAAGEEEKQLAEIIVQRTFASQRQAQHEAAQARLDRVKGQLDRQTATLQESQKAFMKVEQECAKMAQDVANKKQHTEALLAEVHHSRVKDAPAEYMEMLEQDPDAALTYLLRVANFGPDGARYCADVQRLVHYHRRNNRNYELDCSKVGKKVAQAKRQIAELEESAGKHRKRLQQMASRTRLQQAFTSAASTDTRAAERASGVAAALAVADDEEAADDGEVTAAKREKQNKKRR